MKTDVLFIHRQLAFAVSIKQALERTGTYDVHPFTSVEAAMEYLRGHPQDVALVDFMMPVYSGEEVLVRLREMQPQITVVATPTQTEAEFSRLGLNGMLAAGFTAREFIPAIERALEGRRTGELPKERGAGLLGRVQDDGEGAEKRPPTSVIGYRSLESILDQGADIGQPPAPGASEDATLAGGFPAVPPPADSTLDPATLIESLPVARPNDDMSFLDDVLARTMEEAEAGYEPPAGADAEAEDIGVVTDRLTDAEQFAAEQPEYELQEAPSGTEPLAPLEPGTPDDALFAGFDPNAYGAEYGTRPLSEIEAEDAALQMNASRSAEFEPPGFVLPDMAVEADETPGTPDLFSRHQSDTLPEFDLTGLEDADVFTDEAEAEEQPVDYMAFLNLKPPAQAEADAAPWLSDQPDAAPAAPADDDVFTGLQALFSGEEPVAASSDSEFRFEDLPEAEASGSSDFEDLLNELSPPDSSLRQPSEFDELVASMSTQEQRPPLPARQQQYVDVTLTDDMSSLVEQIEQVRTGTLRSDVTPLNEEAVDLSAVLFVDDEEEGSDTPSTPAEPVNEPALASSEELAALFGASNHDSAGSTYNDFEALMAVAQPEQAAQDAGFESLFAEELSPEVPAAPQNEDFEAFMASFESSAGDTDSIEFEPEEEEAPAYPAGAAEAAFAATTLDEPAALADPDLESLFQPVSPFEDEQPDFNAMFGVEAPDEADAPDAQPELDLFGGDWGEGDVLALDQEPRFEETGTVSDLMTGVEEVTGGSSRTGMLTRLSGPMPPVAPERPIMDTAPAIPPIDDTVTALLAEIELQLAAAPPPGSSLDRSALDDSQDTPARRILETTSGAEQTDSSFSLDHLITNIEAQLPPNQARVQPLPSWVREPAAPPEFLPEMAFGEETVLHAPFETVEETAAHGAPVEAEPPFDWDSASFDETTAMGAAARAGQTVFTGDEETSWLEFIEPEPGAAAETVLAGAAAAGVAAAVEPSQSDSDWEAVEAEAAASARAMQSDHIDDPYIAQLALSLTDVSLELTADAILLTRERDIAAFAGRMSRDELLELRQVIDDDWEAAANDARIRFLRLPGSGKDVMLYSRHTVEDLTLSLVFDGAMPLRDIRLQGKRLMDALAAVPETPVEIVLPPPEEDAAAYDESLAVPRSPHAYVWLLRDPEGSLARPVAQAIVTGLNQQMTEHGWRVREMRASEDHVYLLADAPDEQPPYVAVRELMRRSAQIAHVQNPSLDAHALWAEAYLVVTPGRPLETDEIQQFIQFERMQ